MSDLVHACKANGITDLIIVHETRGIPGSLIFLLFFFLFDWLFFSDGLIISHLPYGPTAYFALLKPVLRHDITRHRSDDKDEETYGLTTVSQVYPHLIFENLNSKLGGRVSCEKEITQIWERKTFIVECGFVYMYCVGDEYLEESLSCTQRRLKESHHFCKSRWLHLIPVSSTQEDFLYIIFFWLLSSDIICTRRKREERKLSWEKSALVLRCDFIRYGRFSLIFSFILLSPLYIAL